MSKVENNNYNWFNGLNEYNSNIFTNIKPIDTNHVLNYWNNQIENRDLLAIKEFHKREYRNYLKTLTNDVIRIDFTEIAFNYPKYDNIVRIKFPNLDVINDDFSIIEETKTIYDIEEPEIVQNDDILSQNELIERLNYKTQYLYDVINTYDTYMSLFDDSMKRVILKKVFKLTHSVNTRYTEKKLNNWCDNFINMIDDKVRAIKRKKKDMIRSKKSKETYKTSELRYLNIVRKIESLGYYGFDESQIRDNMKSLEDDEIINDMINEFSEVNQDHDMLERIDEEARIYNENMDIFKHYNGDD